MRERGREVLINISFTLFDDDITLDEVQEDMDEIIHNLDYAFYQEVIVEYT